MSREVFVEASAWLAVTTCVINTTYLSGRLTTG